MKILTNIPKDKLLHSFYGTLIFTMCLYFLSIEYSYLVVLVVGILKECYDYYDYGKFDVLDIIATIAIPSLMWGAL